MDLRYCTIEKERLGEGSFAKHPSIPSWNWSVMIYIPSLAQLQVKILNMLNNNTKKYKLKLNYSVVKTN